MKHWIASALVTDAIRREDCSVNAILDSARQHEIPEEQVRRESLEGGKMAYDALRGASDADRASLACRLVRLCERVRVTVRDMFSRLGEKCGVMISPEGIEKIRNRSLALGAALIFLYGGMVTQNGLAGTAACLDQVAPPLNSEQYLVQLAQDETLRSQGRQPSCTAHAVTFAMEKALGHSLPHDLPDRLWPLMVPVSRGSEGALSIREAAENLTTLTGTPLKIVKFPFGRAAVVQALSTGHVVVCGVSNGLYPDFAAPFEVEQGDRMQPFGADAPGPVDAARNLFSGNGHAVAIAGYLPDETGNPEAYLVYNPAYGNVAAIDAAVMESMGRRALVLERIPGRADPTEESAFLEKLDSAGARIEHVRTDADSGYGAFMAEVGAAEAQLEEAPPEGSQAHREWLAGQVLRLEGAMKILGAHEDEAAKAIVREAKWAAQDGDARGVKEDLGRARVWASETFLARADSPDSPELRIAEGRQAVLEKEAADLIREQWYRDPDLETARKAYQTLDAMAVHVRGENETARIRKAMEAEALIFEALKSGNKDAACEMAKAVHDEFVGAEGGSVAYRAYDGDKMDGGLLRADIQALAASMLQQGGHGESGIEVAR
jgi:hypothetical protein